MQKIIDILAIFSQFLTENVNIFGKWQLIDELHLDVSELIFIFCDLTDSLWSKTENFLEKAQNNPKSEIL
jgi:hypothetical protein